MDSGGWGLGLGVLLGILIGALLAYGIAQLKVARRKIKALEAEKKKAKEIVDKAKGQRQQGRKELAGALFLMLLAVVLAILTAYMLASGGSPS